MREPTNILHKKACGNTCQNKLDKQFWGNVDGLPTWAMSCMREGCGFFKIISNEVFLKWQYCDKVLEEVV